MNSCDTIRDSAYDTNTIPSNAPIGTSINKWLSWKRMGIVNIKPYRTTSELPSGLRLCTICVDTIVLYDSSLSRVYECTNILYDSSLSMVFGGTILLHKSFWCVY